MKKLSDYKDEAAIDLWADLLEYASVIFSDPEVRKVANGSKIKLAKTMLKLHKKEVCEMLLAIDDEPINGLNIVIRLVSILNEVGEDPALRDFFGMQSQNETQESSGSATETTEEKEH